MQLLLGKCDKINEYFDAIYKNDSMVKYKALIELHLVKMHDSKISVHWIKLFTVMKWFDI